MSTTKWAVGLPVHISCLSFSVSTRSCIVLDEAKQTNAEKNEFILIGHPNTTEKFCKDKETKYLGVIVDESMNWEEQLKIVKRKMKTGYKLKTSFPETIINCLPSINGKPSEIAFITL